MTNKCIKSGCFNDAEAGSNYCSEHELKNQTEKKRYDDDQMEPQEGTPTVT